MPNAVIAGRIPGGGSSVAVIDASSLTRSAWPPNATTMPAALAARPSAPVQDEQRERAPPRRAEAAEHRRGVEVAAQMARCRERDGDGGEDHRDECGEAKKLSARSSVCLTSGRRSRTFSIRWPGCNADCSQSR